MSFKPELAIVLWVAPARSQHAQDAILTAAKSLSMPARILPVSTPVELRDAVASLVSDEPHLILRDEYHAFPTEDQRIPAFARDSGAALNCSMNFHRSALADELEDALMKAKSFWETINTLLSRTVLVGRSRSLLEVLWRAWDAARCDCKVLITNGTGTGKGVVAHQIHLWSHRKGSPFQTVVGSAYASTLVESELFGHEKGAFSGAVAQKIGVFERADGGTVFLDEVGDLPMEVQTKLLRFLQHREFERVGGTKTIGVNVRVIAATHRNLERLIEEGKFRDDLYFRLNELRVRVPSLAERPDDIPFLVTSLVKQICEELSSPLIPVLARDTTELLRRYPWPGNVRELRAVLLRAVIECLPQATMFPFHVKGLRAQDTWSPTAIPLVDPLPRLDDHLVDVEGALLSEAEKRFPTREGQAKALGLGVRTFTRRLKKHGLL